MSGLVGRGRLCLRDRPPVPGRSRLTRVVSDGDTLSIALLDRPLRSYEVRWSGPGRRMAVLRQPGSGVSTTIGEEGVELVDGLHISVAPPRSNGRSKARALLFQMEPYVGLRHIAAVVRP